LALKTLAVFALIQWILLEFISVPLADNVYGLLGIKRERLPLSTVSPFDAALDVGSLGPMFASHVVSNLKAADEFRVLVLGDSTIWGLQLRADEVLPGQFAQLALTCGSKKLRFYNLSFPRSSATKDILILDKALATKPDAIIWLVTWYTLSPKTRVDHWLITQNPDAYQRLATLFDFLPKDYTAPKWPERVLARDRAIFRAIRYQLYAAVQMATARDQIPGPPQIPATELSPDETFEGLKPPTLRSNQVSIDQVEDFYVLAGGIPILLVNEPIQIVLGTANADLRYNSYYPRWIYDQYRTNLAGAAAAKGWDYLDLWSFFPEQSFADTPLHLKPEAHRKLAEYLAPRVQAMCP
jgi:hypothetical protein